MKMTPRTRKFMRSQMDDHARAKEAKQCAKEEMSAGNMSRAEYEHVVAECNQHMMKTNANGY